MVSLSSFKTQTIHLVVLRKHAAPTFWDSPENWVQPWRFCVGRIVDLVRHFGMNGSLIKILKLLLSVSYADH